MKRTIVAEDFIKGLIDMHIHTAPDVGPRLLNDIEAASSARDAGMQAILIKSHYTLTADRASIAELEVGGIRVFGGLVLNAAVGGLNPEAVETALRMGAKEIWMPTISARHVHSQRGENRGISVFTKDGKFSPELYEIIKLIIKHNAILATGHLSPEESLALVAYAQDIGLHKFLVTHPEAAFIQMPIQTQKDIASKGVFFERCYVDTTQVMDNPIRIRGIVKAIREVGVESTVLTTDFGQIGNPPPVEGMRSYLSDLITCDFKLHELRQMAEENPAYLLDL